MNYLNVRKNSRRTYDNDNFPPSLQYKKYSPWETPNYKPEHELPHNNNLNDIKFNVSENTIVDKDAIYIMINNYVSNMEYKFVMWIWVFIMEA